METISDEMKEVLEHAFSAGSVEQCLVKVAAIPLTMGLFVMN